MKLINLKNYLNKYLKLLFVSLIIFFITNISNANNNFEKNLKKKIFSSRLSQIEINNLSIFFKNLDKDLDNKLTFDEISKADFIYQIELNKFKKLMNKEKFYPLDHTKFGSINNFTNFFKKNKFFFDVSDIDFDNKLNKNEFLNALIANQQLLNFLTKFLYSLDNSFNYHQYDFYNAKINYLLLIEFLNLNNNFNSNNTDYIQNDKKKDYFFYYTFLDLYEIAIQE